MQHGLPAPPGLLLQVELGTGVPPLVTSNQVMVYGPRPPVATGQSWPEVPSHTVAPVTVTVGLLKIVRLPVSSPEQEWASTAVALKTWLLLTVMQQGFPAPPAVGHGAPTGVLPLVTSTHVTV